MKIEFKKVPSFAKELIVKKDLVTIKGTFCKVSPTLVKIDAVLTGNSSVNCTRCNELENIELNEKLDFLLSDGIYKNKINEEVVVEIYNSLIDFNEIIESELNSLKSDYYICKNCLENSNEFEKEF